MAPLVEETLKEYRDLAKASREAIPWLRRTSNKFENTARNWWKRFDVLLQTNQDKLIKSLDNLMRTLDNFNDAILRMATVFNEENQRNLAATLKNVHHGSDNLESISENTTSCSRRAGTKPRFSNITT